MMTRGFGRSFALVFPLIYGAAKYSTVRSSMLLIISPLCRGMVNHQSDKMDGVLLSWFRAKLLLIQLVLGRRRRFFGTAVQGCLCKSEFLLDYPTVQYGMRTPQSVVPVPEVFPTIHPNLARNFTSMVLQSLYVPLARPLCNAESFVQYPLRCTINICSMVLQVDAVFQNNK
jgi:hypothetical protein